MSGSLHISPPTPSRNGDFSIGNLLLLASLTVFAFLIMGYHPGLEDDAFYLAAIKRNLNPVLFSHDSEFFRLQFQATIFDKLIALSVRLSHLPLASWLLADQPSLLRPAASAMGRSSLGRLLAHSACIRYCHHACRPVST